MQVGIFNCLFVFVIAALNDYVIVSSIIVIAIRNSINCVVLMWCYFYWMMYTLVFSPGLLRLTTNHMCFSELWIQCTGHHLLDESNWLVLNFVNIKCYYRYVTKQHLHSSAKALHKYFEILLALHLIYPLVESISIMIMLRLLLWRFDISKVAQETNMKS